MRAATAEATCAVTGAGPLKAVISGVWRCRNSNSAAAGWGHLAKQHHLWRSASCHPGKHALVVLDAQQQEIGLRRYEPGKP